ncbi:MAG TPA: class I SAM-dependent methyltransferase [Stellaceae bacterium]|nr:class I SAM-dependent methyltransferase [Stellaceae bacterium]
MTLPGFFEGTEMPDADWWQALWPQPQRVLAQLGLEPAMVAADLCCGDGWFTAPMARQARRVYAIDLDPAMLEAARRRLAAAGLANCRFIAGDAFAIARLVPEPMDFVLLANAFHGVPDRERLARDVRQSIKRGGLFAIIGWHQRPREETAVLGAPRGPASVLRMTPEAVIAAVEPSGFRRVIEAEVSPYHYGLSFRREE